MILESKVVIKGKESMGFGVLVSIDSSTELGELHFFTNAVGYHTISAALSVLLHPRLPNQTRCFKRDNGVTRYGRILMCELEDSPIRTYLVQFGGEAEIQSLRESEFEVRSYLGADDPLEVISELAVETPFFFQHRASFLQSLLRQNEHARGLTSLLSSKIDLLPHQVQIAQHILRDPTIRYLLADEVGLGKTIEAGIILRQLTKDTPNLRVAVFAPDQLTNQWRGELKGRFELNHIPVFGHSEMADQSAKLVQFDMAVIDEAHQLVSASVQNKELAVTAKSIAHKCKHLLLLSATPLLHHDEELLALLELLDPDNYTTNDIAGFRACTRMRVSLGRAFLALSNSTLLPLIKLNAKKLAALVPDDFLVQKLVDELTAEGTDVISTQRQLKLHISETYRIHRRLLRTRRSWLVDAEQHYVRDIEEHAWTDPEGEHSVQLWKVLEEWRTETAARVCDSDEQVNICASSYVLIAEAIAAEPTRLQDVIEEVIARTESTVTEQRLLSKLIDPKAAADLLNIRVELICRILRERCTRDGTTAKYVVFSTSKEAASIIAQKLKENLQRSWIRIATSTMAGNEVGQILADFAHDGTRILVTDAIGEEGFNLQFARTVILHDLPWSPMRIEQRVGRLDRLERVGRITCFDITSGEDETICVDEVWRRILVDGFGIFKKSISDLQHCVDSELPYLRRTVFLGGPQALLAEIEPLKVRLQGERDAVEEQDVIDGMNVTSDSTYFNSVRRADDEASIFGDCLALYLEKNVGLQKVRSEKDSSVSFVTPWNSSPIIPVDRFNTIQMMLGGRSTVFRNVAVEDFSLQFLRPGHVAVDACRELLSWDDRGRAFVMWREVIGLFHVKCIFRCIVHVSVDLTAVMSELRSKHWDSLRSAGLLRMARGWFPDYVEELFIDESGKPVSEAYADLCRHIYHRQRDSNLGKERAALVRNHFGDLTWRNWCATATESSVLSVSNSEGLKRRREGALADAAEQFALARARIEARQRVGIDTSTQYSTQLLDENTVEQLVNKVLGSPSLRVDTIGGYLLSETKFWEDPK